LTGEAGGMAHACAAMSMAGSVRRARFIFGREAIELRNR
jgi:hypothetical protein